MAYFEPSIDAEGIHIPTYADIMDYLTSAYKSIFGEDVYIGEETKDYQLLSIFAKCMDDYAALVVDSYNNRNPNYAEGDSLDLLLPLVSMVRRGATPSTAVLKLTGTANAELSAGLVAIDQNGYLWNIEGAVTFNSSGYAEVNATCDTPGAISAPIGTINGIYTPTVGWTGVTNEAEAKLGRDIETDDEVRLRRKQSVNLQNNGSYDSVMRALLNLEVDGEVAKFVDVVANDTSSTDANGIPAHSICCIVDGIDEGESEIAEAIWKAKAPGIGTYGGPSGSTRISATYTDAFGHVNTINFARPIKSHVTVSITLNTFDTYDATRVNSIIKSAIENGINSLGIGKSWGVTTAYRDVYNAFAGEACPFVIASVTGKTTSMQMASSTEVPCAFSELLIAEDTDITIVISD